MAKRILVVDDNEDNLEVMSETLALSGFEVLRASDGQQCLDIARAEEPDLILLDMSLPVKTGWQVAAELRAQEPTTGVPIIAFTAHALESDRKDALAAGCTAFLAKPVRPLEVVGEIRSLLGEAG